MCRASLFLALGLFAAATAAPAQSPEVQADVNKNLTMLRQLQGTWTAETFDYDGRERAKEDFKDEVLVITDNRFQSKRGDEVLLQGNLKVDPTKTPFHLDLFVTEGNSKGTLSAVYSLKQDVLTICYAHNGKGRPADLKPGEGRTFRVFKRQKESQDKAEAMAATIDQRYQELWRKLDLKPAPLADDAGFLRRVYLDLAGRIPSVGEAREFLNDNSPDKRRRLIDHLTNQPAFQRQVARLMREFLLPETPADMEARGVHVAFENWLLGKLQQKKGYDEITRTMLTASGGNRNRRLIEEVPQAQQGGDAIFVSLDEGKPELLAGRTARVTLGIRLECAQCHNHPSAEWKQEQFWQFAAFFGSAGRPPRLRIPGKKEVATPRFPDNTEPDWQKTTNARQALAQWITDPKNPRFARNAVQRAWHHIHGLGLIEDTEMPEATEQNALLDELAQQFVASGHDMPTLVRGIVLSRVYQLSSKDSQTQTVEPRLFVHHAVKSMAPEQFFDSIAQAAGVTPQNYPRYNADRAAFLNKFLHAPDSRTEYQTSILQALFLMNGSFAAEATNPERGATLAAVVDAPFFTTAERLEILFLATLSRYPTEGERKRLVAYVDSGGTQKDSKRALADVFWALLNSGEFLLHR